MKLRVFSILDVVAKVFNSPMALRTTGEAERFFADLANDGQSNIAKHPEDFHMYELGEFDADTGAISPYDKPRKVGVAVSFKRDAVEASRSFQQ